MASAERAGPGVLDAEHYEALSRALRNVLHTDLALDTYAQMIDGLPTERTARVEYSICQDARHVISQHQQICPGAEDKAIEFRDGFSVDDLEFSSEVITSCPLNSDSFT
jgi:hypothetical protein